MSKKKKIFILVSMVVLLVVTGYLNVALNKRESGIEATTINANFFASTRADKIASRNYQLDIYNNIIKTSTNEDEIKRAQAQIDAISANIDEELVLESLISARGYEDVIVTSSNENLNVFVKTANGLTGDEVGAILAILVNGTGVLPTHIKVFPVK